MKKALITFLLMAVTYLWAVDNQTFYRGTILILMWIIYPFIGLFCAKWIAEWVELQNQEN